MMYSYVDEQLRKRNTDLRSYPFGGRRARRPWNYELCRPDEIGTVSRRVEYTKDKIQELLDPKNDGDRFYSAKRGLERSIDILWWDNLPREVVELHSLVIQMNKLIRLYKELARKEVHELALRKEESIAFAIRMSQEPFFKDGWIL